MRIWDISVSKLCRNHLLGEHRELHAIWSILVKGKKGYSRHPETLRWKGKLAALYLRHKMLVKEMSSRGYKHLSDLDRKYAVGIKKQSVFIDSPGRQVEILRKKNCACKVAVIAVFFCMSIFLPQIAGYAQRQSRVMEFSAERWQSYRNERQGYSLKLPSEIRTNFTRKRDRVEAAQGLLPFDYVNFGPKQARTGQEPFELGLGVHWNKNKMTTRVFADLKDVGVKKGVRQYVTIRSSAVTVAGIQGVRDDFKLEKEDGWTSYSRVTIPFKDEFICFLCTIGSDNAVAEYERVFQKIIDSFEIQK